MKKSKIVALCALTCAALALIITQSATADAVKGCGLPVELACDGAVRLALGFILVAAAVITGYGENLRPFRVDGAASVLWCLPCLLVVLANFPFTALINGEAAVDYPRYIWLFALKCLGVGVLEEMIFRVFLQSTFIEVFKAKKRGLIIAVAVNSAIFGLWHLTNLFSGADVGQTLMQTGYTFLTGAMFSAIILRTKNFWIAALFHAAFNFAGTMVPTLGHGAFQDVWFWVFTAIAAVICGVHVILYLIRADKNATIANR